MAGSRGLDARRGAVRLDGFDGNGRGRGRGAVAVLLARQDNVRLGSESLRANEIQRPRERPSPVLPASPAQLLGRAGNLEEQEPASGDFESGYGPKKRVGGLLVGEDPARAVGLEQTHSLRIRGRQEGLARQPVVVAVRAVGILVEEIGDVEGRAGLRDQLLDLRPGELDHAGREIGMRGAGRENVEFRQPLRDMHAAGAADRGKDRGRPVEVLFVGRNEERQGPGKREQQRRQTEQVAVSADRPPRKEDEAHDGGGHETEQRVSPEGSAQRRQQRLRRRREPGKQRADRTVERTARTGEKKRRRVDHDQADEQRGFATAGAPLVSTQPRSREPRQQRDAQGRQQIELDRIPQPPQGRHGEEKGKERQ